MGKVILHVIRIKLFIKLHQGRYNRFLRYLKCFLEIEDC